MASFSGNRLKALRKEKGLSQAELARTLGVAGPSITKYERGERSPEPNTLGKILDFFDVSLDYMYGRSGERNAERLLMQERDMDLAKLLDDINTVHIKDSIADSLHNLQNNMLTLEMANREEILRCLALCIYSIGDIIKISALGEAFKLELVRLSAQVLRNTSLMCKELMPVSRTVFETRDDFEIETLKSTYRQGRDTINFLLIDILFVYLELWKNEMTGRADSP